MDVMSSSFAVVSLAIQLLETTQKIRCFLHDVRDAPREIERLADSLDQLHGTLDDVKSRLEQQYLVLRLPGSPVHMIRALENCKKTIQQLESFVKKAKESFGHQQRVKRTWASMRFASARETIQELQVQLRDAKTDLQIAIMSNVWQSQMHTIQLVSHSLTKTSNNVEDRLTSMEPIQVLGMNLSKELSVFPNLRKTAPTVTKTRTLWYRGILGVVTVDKESRYIRQDGNHTEKSQKAMSEKTIILVTPTFLNRQLEMRFTNTFGSISRALQTYPVVADLAELETESCIAAGDVEALQLMFSSRAVSPFVLSEEGQTLLHRAALANQPETCTFLIKLGVDPDRKNKFSETAFHYISLKDDYIVPETYLDTLRVLTQAQDDFTGHDLKEFTKSVCLSHDVPTESADIILSLEPVQYYLSKGPELETDIPVLAVALSWSTFVPSKTEAFVRKLIRKGADLHARVPRLDWPPSRLPCGAYGTLLDEVLGNTSTPFEARIAADTWLQLLMSEGRDMRKYMEKERDLHVNDEFFTWPYSEIFEARVLQFDLGSSPRVWWEWYIDPSASIPELRQELDHIAMLDLGYLYPWKTWEDMWPYEYPPWFDDFDPGNYEWRLQERPEWKRINKLAHERINRRKAKKAAKAARAQGLKTKRSPMPGAWPA